MTKYDYYSNYTPVTKPSATVDKYVIYYNSQATSPIYNLLSSKAKEKYNKDDVHNIIYALTSSGVYIYEHKVTKQKIQGSNAQLTVEITWYVHGYHKTKTYDVSLTLEDGEWKLDQLITY
ncbi:NTF2-like N-terminal transpeptidase domain-containing protein [Archaeoglobus sp.]